MGTQQQNNWPFIINVGNSIIGVTILAMPFCFQQCGVILGSLMLFFATWLTIKSCQLLVKAGTSSRRRSFSLLAYFTHGATGKLIVEVCMIGLQLGTLVAQVVIIGDLGPAILSKATGFENTSNLRTSLIVCLCLFVGLPLGLLKDLRSLSKASTMCILFYTFFTCYVVLQSIPHLLHRDWYTKIRFWRFEGFFQCLPIFSFAFGCQTQLFIVYNALAEPSLKRINSIISSAVLLCTAAYLLVAFFGYIAFSNEEELLTGDIINHFKENNISDAIKLCFVFSIAVSIPLIVYPCRTAIYTLVFPQKPKDDVPGSGKIPELHFQIITAAIITGAMVTGILVPNVEFVLGLTGATMGTLICYIFPALFFIHVMSEASEGRFTSKIVLLFGLVILVASTYTTLNPADKAPEQISLAKDLVNNPADINSILQKRDEPDIGKKVGNLDLDAIGKPPDESVLTGDVKRQEPPIPQEPDDTGQIEHKDTDKGKHSEKKDTANGFVDEQFKVNVEEFKKESVKLKEEKERLQEEEEKRKKEEEQKKEEEEKLKKEKEKEEQEKKEEEERKRIEAEKKQEVILEKLEQQQEEQQKLIQEQKEILEELKQHKDDHKDAPVDAVPAQDQKLGDGQQGQVQGQIIKQGLIQPGQNQILNQQVQGQQNVLGQLPNQNPPINQQVQGQQNVLGQLPNQNPPINQQVILQQPLQNQPVLQNAPGMQQPVINQQGMGQNIDPNLVQNPGQNIVQNPPQNVIQNMGQNLGQNVLQNQGQNLVQNQGLNVGQNVVVGQQPVQQQQQQQQQQFVQQPLMNQQIVGQQNNQQQLNVQQGQQVVQGQVLGAGQQGQMALNGADKDKVNLNLKGQDGRVQPVLKHAEKAVPHDDLDKMKHRGKRNIGETAETGDKEKVNDIGTNKGGNKNTVDTKEIKDANEHINDQEEILLKKDSKHEKIEQVQKETKEVNLNKPDNIKEDQGKNKDENRVGEAKDQDVKQKDVDKENSNGARDIKDNPDNNGQRDLKMVIDDKENPPANNKADSLVSDINVALDGLKDKLKYDDAPRLNILDVQKAGKLRKR